MKVIIAGGRDYQFTPADIAKLDRLHEDWKIAEVVSGGATGADACGEAWAKSRGIPVRVFKAEWNRLGRKAGPIRNKAMSEYADAVVLFSGGNGTENMHQQAVAKGLKIVDWRNSQV